MTRIFNRNSETEKRQYLRAQAPQAEKLLWNRLRRRQIAGVKFRRQYSVERFVLDFYAPQRKLAIEIDGPTHMSAAAKDYDKYRQSFIERLDIQFLRFTNQEIYQNIEGVVLTIHQQIRPSQDS
ncbi:MAG: endonuclease domain-containing protein [Cyanobacteria bacterium J06598_1]